jgi:hypothetical protein
MKHVQMTKIDNRLTWNLHMTKNIYYVDHVEKLWFQNSSVGRATVRTFKKGRYPWYAMIIYYRKLQIPFNVRIKVWILRRAKCNLCYDCLLCEMNKEEYLAIVITYLMSICINISYAVHWIFRRKSWKTRLLASPRLPKCNESKTASWIFSKSDNVVRY